MHSPILRCMLCDCSRLLQLHFCRLFDQDLGPTLPACNQCCEGMVANKDSSLSSDPLPGIEPEIMPACCLLGICCSSPQPRRDGKSPGFQPCAVTLHQDTAD